MIGLLLRIRDLENLVISWISMVYWIKDLLAPILLGTITDLEEQWCGKGLTVFTSLDWLNLYPEHLVRHLARTIVLFFLRPPNRPLVMHCSCSRGFGCFIPDLGT